MRSAARWLWNGALCLVACSAAHAQETTWTKPPPVSQPAAQQAAEQVHGAQPAATPAPGDQPSGTSVRFPRFYVPVAGRKNKLEYVGPKSPLELPGTPMLDVEGRQRIDPAGNPMFNPSTRQQRDRHGNPAFDDRGEPVMQTPGNMGFDERGKRIREKKIKVLKTASISIQRGIFTVDGMAGKAGLNYEVKNLKYIYLYTPWIGITIVSPEPFAGAAEQKNAFVDRTLTVTVEDHLLQLYSDKRLFGKPRHAYVAVDRNFKMPSKYPLIGFGDTLQPPYSWPGSRDNVPLGGPVAAPPLPAALRAARLE